MRYIFIIVAFFIFCSVLAQEQLVGLQVNPVVKAKALEQNLLKAGKSGLDTIPIELPFFDDFREATVFPVEERWIDHYAFVNTDIPVFPVNRGAVTMDAISDSGQMYHDAVPGPETFLADLLTSRYIRLDSIFTPFPKALSPADSVFLSFWYQPQGRGKPPHVSDSLLLRFLVEPARDSISPTDTTLIEAKWQNVWATKGLSLDTFYLRNNKYFIQVMIPVVDSHFFKKTFQFQFYNYVSLASSAEPSWQSNCCQWNIDQVYLNSGRSWSDTLRPEITFIERPPSMLKSYAAMPYPQYSDNPTNEMADTLDILISNRDLQNHNSAYDYVMRTPSGSWEEDYNGGEYIIKPFYTYGYVTYIPFAHPTVQYLFPISTQDSALFEVEHALGALDGSNFGDTMKRYQVFYNYFAYDDGTPDAGYGLSFADSRLAYRFKLNKSPDTLRAVQFFFNQTLSGDNVQFFYLTIRNDNNGKPGEVLFDTLVRPKFADSLNKFVTYHLIPPLSITATFYVGWKQTTNENLNVGFDRYNNSRQQILYNVVGEWVESAFNGSLMIRPIVGKPIPLGIAGPGYEPLPLKIYPNPASNGFFRMVAPANLNQTEQTFIRIHNLLGQEVYRSPFRQQIDVSGMESGIYVVSLSGTDDQILATARLVITR